MRLAALLRRTTAGTLLLVAAGCGASLPTVTVVSGRGAATTTAQAWCTGTATFPGKGCRTSAHDAPVVDVAPSLPIGVAVPPDVARGGWYVVVGGARSPVQHDVDYVLSPKVLRPGANELRVVALAGDGRSNRGLWLVRLQLP